MNAADRGLSTSAAFTLAAAFLAYVLASGLVVARAKGLWLDEVWSLWMSRHDVSFAEALRQRWLEDTNPPLFYAAAWLTEPVTRLDLFAARLLNLIPLGLAVAAFGWIALTRPSTRRFAVVFAVLAAGSTAFPQFFGEHRSYFTQLCAASVLALAFYAVEIEGGDFDGRRDGLLVGIIAAATLLAFDLHQAAALISGCVLAAMILVQLFSGRRKWAAVLFAIGVVAALPLLAGEVLQARYLAAAARDFWITTGEAEAAHTLVGANLKALLLNGVAACAAVFMLTELRGRPPGPQSASLRFAAVTASALVIASLAFLLLNMVKPIVIPRYLVTVTPYWRAVLAALAAEVILGRRWLFGLFLANAALVAAFAVEGEAFTGNWGDGARIIQDQVQACPSTLVYAVDPFRLQDGRGPPEGPASASDVHEWGYAYEARAYGFPVTIVHPAETARLPLARNCPTLLWGEHDYDNRLGLAEIARRAGLPADPASLGRMRLTRTDSGFVISVPPAR
jgi:hypothetical protein